MTDQPRPTCTATTAAGQPCKAAPLPDRSECFAHADDLAERRAEARARGGRNRAALRRLERAMPDTLGDTLGLLVDAMAATAAGRMAPARGQALASIARAIVAVHVEHETEARIADLERRLDDLPAVTRHLTEVRS